ncbi:hypothetical protein BiPBO1_27 [Brucella phage BiPBO1]|uniref:hypothetical protein n=1 Tax=Brucella phage BiPBO1 TaxID=1718278 RepID=UPI00046CDB99|nr:hypothetical protein [Brucella inopinata]YP_009304055.1 hypothetical protein BJD47_gp27 [Brucella phage BiPBO1]ALJ98241.1 hypothetical protein BiPBO1_27 [Brucella phage BiPBO1]KEY03594.1 hypothetical protein IL59_0215670 [Brucella suis bv. 4 str. 40]
MKKLPILLFPLILIACAKDPKQISAMQLPSDTYASYSCERLAQEHARSTSNLANAVKLQNQARNEDVMGVFLIGVPMSSAMGNDRESWVAQHKGELVAIEAMQKRKGCK